jgi:putative peptidoglycan lipid II flippase
MLNITRRSLAALRQRLPTLNADERLIAVGAAWIASFVVLGKLAGAAKEMAIAWRFGVSETVDAYYLATTLIFWMPSTLISVLSIVLVPMLVRIRHADTEPRERFLRELHTSVVFVGLMLGFLSAIIAPFALLHIGDKLSVASRAMAWQLCAGMAPVVPLVLMIGVYSARLMARERQINTLLEGVPAVAILLMVLFWPAGANVGPLLIGTLIGISFQALCLSRLARLADGYSTRARFSWTSPHWHELYKAASVVLIGQFAMSCITPLDQYTAAQLGDGSIATLGYANRLMALLIGVGAIAVARGALPVMSRLHAAGDSMRACEIAFRWAKITLALGILVAAITWLLAPWAIGLLFERGAFTNKDTQQVVHVFRWGLLQLPFYFPGLVFVQLLASHGRYRTIALFAASNLIVKVALNFSLASWIGVAGISLATALMTAWSASCLYYAATRVQAVKS